MLILSVAALISSFSCTAIADSGDSSREARAVAKRALPMRQLPENLRNEVCDLIDDAALFRSMPTRVIDCDRELFDMMVQRPDVMVDIWRVLGISKLKLRRIADDHYEMTDATGTTGDVRVLYSDVCRNGDRRVLVQAQGVYDAPPMPRPVKATTVFLLNWRPFLEANGRTYVRSKLDAFVHINRPTAELVARAVQPLAVKTADHNFVETMRFISLFSLSAQRNPDGAVRLASQLTGIDPPTRSRLVAVCNDAAQRSADRARMVTARARSSEELNQVVQGARRSVNDSSRNKSLSGQLR